MKKQLSELTQQLKTAGYTEVIHLQNKSILLTPGNHLDEKKVYAALAVLKACGATCADMRVKQGNGMQHLLIRNIDLPAPKITKAVTKAEQA